jgi:hypothetical protein
MSASNGMENAVLLLYLNNTAHANIGDASGLQPSGTAGSLYISLHTGDPGEAGDQTTSECAYTSYARVAVARSGAGWTVSGNNGSNTADVSFPQAGGGTETATHFGVGTDSSGAGNLLFSGTLSPNVSISNGVRPVIPAGDLDINAD